MTVAELIAELQKLPQDVNVVRDDKWEMVIDSVQYVEEDCSECKTIHKYVKV